MSARPEPPEEARWALALDGIAQLSAKIDALAETQRAFREELIDLRKDYTRLAPMHTVQLLDERMLTVDRRVGELERGATAAILTRLDTDREERERRQAVHDRRALREMLVWGLVILALLGDVALRLWGI